MNHEQALQLAGQANPLPNDSTGPDGFLSMTALLDRIDERSTDVQTQERPRTEHDDPRDRRRRWLIPALAGAAAVILAIVVGALLLAGGSDEPDVIEPTPTTTPTTVPEAAAPSPFEVMDLHSEAVAAADWAGLKALYADTAEFEVNSETGETFLERIALTDLEAQTPYDWDGDGVVDGFDALIDDAARVAAHGATAFVSCSQVDDVTAVCDEVWEGHQFTTPGIRHNTWTVTIVDGVITTQVLEVVQRENRPVDTDLTSQYNMWVSENRPELEQELFDDIITLAISPDTVPVHRELIAEWLADRDSAIADRSPLEVTDLYNEATAAGDWQARSALHAGDVTYQVVLPDGSTPVDVRLFDDLAVQAGMEDWDGDGRLTEMDHQLWIGADFYAGGTTTFLSCSQLDAATAVCDDVREGFAFLSPARQPITYTFTISDGLIEGIVVEVGEGEDPTDPDAVALYEQWVVENRPDLVDDLFFLDGKRELTTDNVDTHRELVAEWLASG